MGPWTIRVAPQAGGLGDSTEEEGVGYKVGESSMCWQGRGESVHARQGDYGQGNGPC